MCSGRREELATIVRLNPQNFQVQTLSIQASVDTGMGGIGYDIYRVGWTYMAQEISTGKSIDPLDHKFKGDVFTGHNLRFG